MIKVLLLFLFVLNNINANDMLKQKNVLTVKNIIQREESIAIEFEKYLLKELKIPAIGDLISDEYLGSSFKLSSNLGNDIQYNNINNLELKISINNPTNENSYIKQLYIRELYRNNTIVDWTNGVVHMILKSDEAKNIFEILKAGAVIESTCSDTLVSKYCQPVDSKLSLRWYNSSSQWIEYNKKTFTNGPVAIFDEAMIGTETKLDDLPIGTKIYIQDVGIKLKVDSTTYLGIDL